MEVGKKPYNASKGIIFQLMVKLNFEQVFGSLFQVHGALTTVSWHKLLSLVKWWYNNAIQCHQEDPLRHCTVILLLLFSVIL